MKILKNFNKIITYSLLGMGHCLRLPEKKGPRPKWTIYKHKSVKNEKYLSIVNFGIPSVVVWCSVARLQPTPAYV